MAKAKARHRPDMVRVRRFCSRAEYVILKAGGTLRNYRDHYRGGRGGSTSVGFCFTEDFAPHAWKYLKGVVVAEVCLTLDIPREMLNKSLGIYRDVTAPLYGEPRRRLLPEWCLTEYSLATVRLIRKREMYEIISEKEMQLLPLMNAVAKSNLAPA